MRNKLFRPKRFKRRALRRNRKFGKKGKMSIARFRLPGIPDRLQVKLKHATNTIKMQSPFPQIVLFSMNGAEIDSSSKRPLFFDDYAFMYNTYCITASKVTVVLANNSSTNPCQFATVFTNGKPSTTWTYDYVTSCRNAKTGMLASAPGGGVKKYVHYSNYEKITGLKNLVNTPSFQASTTADVANNVPDPANIVWFGFAAEAPDHATDLNVFVHLEVVQYITFLEPRNPLASGAVNSLVPEGSTPIVKAMDVQCKLKPESLGATGPEGGWKFTVES